MSKVEKKQENVATPKGTAFVPPKIKKMITLPLLKAPLDKPVYFVITDPVTIGKAIGDKDAAIIANVFCLETRQQMQFLVPAVMQGILHDEYGAPKYGKEAKDKPVQEMEPPIAGQTKDAYVGKGFMVTKKPKGTGKQYHPHNLAELDITIDDVPELKAQ